VSARWAGPVIVAVALAAAGCAVSAQTRAQVVNPNGVPFGLLDPSPSPAVPTGSASPTEAVALCFINNGALVVVSEPLPAPVHLLAAVAALAQPPEVGGQSLQTAMASPEIVNQVTLQGGIATVDLKQAISALGGENQLLAVAQIVCTLTDRPGVGQVSFTLAGTPALIPRSDGSLVSTPVSRDDYASLIH
jgi:spore germination protein GerM